MKSRETKKVNIALTAYTPRLCKLNRFNMNGLFSRDNYWLLLAEGHLHRRLFGQMLRRIWALPMPSG